MSTSGNDEQLLARQLEYYDERAGEYDDWFFRRGRYDRGAAATEQWFAEVHEVRQSLGDVDWAGRHVLELAPGTGLWSQWLLDRGAQLSVVDGSPAMLEQLRRRLAVRSSHVHFEQADLFAWAPTRTYDGVFFGFFLSHVPRRELSRFFALVASALAPGGRFGFVDSLRDQCSTAHDHVLPEVDDEIMTRRLDDGREFQIVKNFFEPDELREVAATVGLELRASSTERYFLYGSGERH